MRLFYTPTFVRQYDDLPRLLQEEAKDRLALFVENPRNPSLRTHKLKGKLKGQWSFSVNYRYRIVFCYDAKDVIALLAIGDHSIYQ